MAPKKAILAGATNSNIAYQTNVLSPTSPSRTTSPIKALQLPLSSLKKDIFHLSLHLLLSSLSFPAPSLRIYTCFVRVGRPKTISRKQNKYIYIYIYHTYTYTGIHVRTASFPCKKERRSRSWVVSSTRFGTKRLPARLPTPALANSANMIRFQPPDRLPWWLIVRWK